uniref:DNA polymerase delta subunit 2 n=1 Tax=Ditylenchus dipsaci TaxID=166011 RepID=A0A915E7U1_9BILA
MTQRIIRSAKSILGPNIKISQLADVTMNGEFFVIGVILKKMKYRRSVLYGFTDEETMDFDFREKLRSDCLVSDEDSLELEDYQQIIKLVIPWPLLEKDSYVLFISGISLSGRMEQNEAVLFGLEKLSKWICGETVLSERELDVVSNISRVIVAAIEDQRLDFLGTEQELDKNAVCQFDAVLSKFVNNVSVDVMPGLNDPTSMLVPQQPIPRAVFPQARRFGKLLNTVTNPYKFSLGGMHFLGTAGQNIQDLLRLTTGLSALDLMEKCLERGHTFPTVPDSVDGFPLQNRDPLVVDDLPHVLFAGNQASLAFKMVKFPDGKKTLLLTIPTFRSSQCAALLNLRTLKLRQYDFSQSNDLLS